MTYKQQFTELLCTVPEIKEQIMEVKTGTHIRFIKDIVPGKDDWFDGFKKGEVRIISDSSIECEGDHGERPYMVYDFVGGKSTVQIQNTEIIGNLIEYHHLMMYVYHKKDKAYGFTDYGKFFCEEELIAVFDPTKPLSEQTEEVYKQLLTNLR